jgi:hypothetical protein
MEACSSTEMDAPGASHLGTETTDPKTDRSRPRSVPVNALVVIKEANSRMVGNSSLTGVTEGLPVTHTLTGGDPNSC